MKALVAAGADPSVLFRRTITPLMVCDRDHAEFVAHILQLPAFKAEA